MEFLKGENDTFCHLLEGYHLCVRSVEDENRALVNKLESLGDRLWELEHWVDHREEERVQVDRASSVIDLTRGDEEEEVIEIPGFPDVVDIPQTLVPLDDENLPGEVRIP